MGIYVYEYPVIDALKLNILCMYVRVKHATFVSAGAVGFRGRECRKQCNSYCEPVCTGTIILSLIDRERIGGIGIHVYVCTAEIWFHYTTANGYTWIILQICTFSYRYARP